MRARATGKQKGREMWKGKGSRSCRAAGDLCKKM